MNHNHVDRFCALRGALANEGRAVKGYALVACDDQGEVYWGADWMCLSEEESQQLVARLRVIVHDITREHHTPTKVA
jgi:hypothetical protein